MDERITLWKRDYGRIFKVRISGQDYIYRTLNVGECGKVLYLLHSNAMVEAEDVALGAVLHPKINLNDIPVPVARFLSDFIIAASEIFEADGLKKVITVARKNVEQLMSNDFTQWKLALLSVFPGYSFDDLDRMPVQKFFDLIILAEEFSGKSFIDYKKLNISGGKKRYQSRGRPPIENTKDSKELELTNTTKSILKKHKIDEETVVDAHNSLREHWLKYKKR
jgi:hypothetical protein